MGFGFPIFIDVKGNNCLILGGNAFAAEKARVLLQFGAKVTVISPTLDPFLLELEEKRQIRYIPRRYFRGDCANACLCIAATGDDAVNISIAQECKARKIFVCVEQPEIYGTFAFPNVIYSRSLTVALSDTLEPPVSQELCRQLAQALPPMLEKALHNGRDPQTDK